MDTIQFLINDIYDFIAEIACYGNLDFECHSVNYPGRVEYDIKPDTQSVFNSFNGREWSRVEENDYGTDARLYTIGSSYYPGDLLRGVAIRAQDLPYRMISASTDEDLNAWPYIVIMPFKSIDYANYDSTLDNPPLIEQAPLEMTHVSIDDLKEQNG